MSSRVFLGAGSRHGDRLALLGAAVRRLRDSGVTVAGLSSVYETEPIGLAGDEPLLNGVIEAAPDLAPDRLLQICLEVEREMGRTRPPAGTARPDPGHRPMDLDLLLHGSLVLSRPGLALPHPRMHLRRFVLVPLAEIAPGAPHPLLGVDCATLLRRCPDTSWVKLHASAEAWARAASLK